MFLREYLDEYYYYMVINNYDSDYLRNLDKNNFLLVYRLFNNYGFYYINDIILRYLEIFDMPVEEVEKKINKLKEQLGDNYIYIIGKKMSYLSEILNDTK